MSKDAADNLTMGQAIRNIEELERFFENASKRAQEEADNLKGVRGSEAAAGEGWYQKDATEYKNVAHCMRDVLGIIG